MADGADEAEGVLSGAVRTAQQGAPVLGRRMSALQLASLLGCSRNTLDAHLADGAPYVQRGDAAKGIKWIIDVAEYVKWLVEREKAKAKGPALGPDDVDWELLEKQKHPAALEYRQLLSKTVTAEMARAELEKSVARIQPLVDLVAADRAAVSSKMMGIGRQVVDRELADLPKNIRMRVEDAVNARMRQALESMKDGEELMETALALADA